MKDTASPTAPLLSPTLQDIVKQFRLLGWGSFWLELGLAFIAIISLLFAWSGRSFSEQTLSGISASLFFALSGIIVLGINIYFAFRYTQIAKGLRLHDLDLYIPKSETISLLRTGIITALVGILLNLLGAGASLGVQIAKVLSQPPGVAITDPNKIIRGLDVFVAVANVDAIAAHLIALVIALWLVEKLHHS